jgi:hypothetical protein
VYIYSCGYRIYRYIENNKGSEKVVTSYNPASKLVLSRTCVNLPKYVIRRLSNSVKICFEYHTVFRAVKYWAI